MPNTLDNILGNGSRNNNKGMEAGTRAGNTTRQGTTTSTPAAATAPQAARTTMASASQEPAVNDQVNHPSPPTPPSRQSVVNQMASEKAKERVPDIGGGNTGRRMTNVELLNALNPYTPPTKEELEKERKKQKREQMFAAIGDGISALSNLYFTTRYAPNMYAPRQTRSERVRNRWEKLAAERAANMKAYTEGLMKARQADDEYDDKNRRWRRDIGLDKAKQERDRVADELAKMKQKAQEAKDKAATDIAERRQKETERHNRAMEAAANRRASGNGGGSGRGSGRGRESNNANDTTAAYRYFADLTPGEKQQYRDMYKRTKGSGFNKNTTADNDDFVKFIWENRKAYLLNNGRGDEIAAGGFNLRGNRGFNVNDYKRSGTGKKGNSAPPLN